MRFGKKLLSLVLTAAVAVGTVAVAPTQKEADAASKVTAYLCFASKNFNGVKSNHNDKSNPAGVYNGNKKSAYSGLRIKNATIKKGKFTATVTISGSNLKKFASDKGWNTIYVDTSLAGSQKSKLKVTKATLKIDGKTVKTIKKPTITPDPGASADYTQVMVVNAWNSYAEKKCKAASITKMPKKSISVTITGTLK